MTLNIYVERIINASLVSQNIEKLLTILIFYNREKCSKDHGSIGLRDVGNCNYSLCVRRPSPEYPPFATKRG